MFDKNMRLCVLLKTDLISIITLCHVYLMFFPKVNRIRIFMRINVWNISFNIIRSIILSKFFHVFHQDGIMIYI